MALGNSTTSRQFSASCIDFQCGSASSSRSPTWSTKRCVGTLPATWLATTASSPPLAKEEFGRLTLVRFCQSDAHQYRRTSDSRTCDTTVLESRWRSFYLDSGSKAQCNPSPFWLRLRSTYLLTFLSTNECYLMLSKHWLQFSMQERDKFWSTYGFCGLPIIIWLESEQ